MTTWQAIASTENDIHSWDDEHVLYHTPSGNTHLLGAAAAEILFRLREFPADETMIADFVAEKMQLEVNEDFLRQLHDMLLNLQSISLIKQVA